MRTCSDQNHNKSVHMRPADELNLVATHFGMASEVSPLQRLHQLLEDVRAKNPTWYSEVGEEQRQGIVAAGGVAHWLWERLIPV